MQQTIKDLGELDKLVSESTSQTVMKADLAKFKRISDILNSKTNLPKEFIKLLKTKVMALKFPRSQMMLFEVIEYTTCKCPGPLHNEYNNKDFLQTLNSIFNQKNLSDEVRNKLLSLIQFWNVFFDAKRDIYPNFNWYFNLIQSRKVPFPPYKQSPYFDQKVSLNNQVQPSVRQQGGFDSSQQPSFGNDSGQGEIFDSMNDKQKKLFKDLSVVVDNVSLANSMMDQNERDIGEIIDLVQKTESKLQPLLEKLQSAGEGFLHAYCQAILQDTSFTMNRYSRYMQKQATPRFSAQSGQIIEMAKQMFAQSQPAQQPVQQPVQQLSADPFSQGFSDPSPPVVGNQVHGFEDQFGFGPSQTSQPSQQVQPSNDHGFGLQGQVPQYDQQVHQQGNQGFGDFGGQPSQLPSDNTFGNPADFGFNQNFQAQGNFGDFDNSGTQQPQQPQPPVQANPNIQNAFGTDQGWGAF